MKSKMNTSTKTIVQAGMFAAIIVVLSQIAIPMPSGVPVTLQTFAIALCGYVLGKKNGVLSTGIYILLGTLGLPVFAKFSGGIGVLFGMTGGFIWGFLILAFLSGVHTHFKSKMVGVVLGLVGLVICHVLGVIQFSVVTSTPLLKSLFLVSIPYLIKDVVSIVAAYFVASTVRKRLISAHLIEHA